MSQLSQRKPRTKTTRKALGFWLSPPLVPCNGVETTGVYVFSWAYAEPNGMVYPRFDARITNYFGNFEPVLPPSRGGTSQASII
jgi:hypothetical protein